MKKVLLISHAFKEKERVGSIRSRGLAKYLKKLGWEPTILTVQSKTKSDDEFRLIETQYTNLLANRRKSTQSNNKNTMRDALNPSSNIIKTKMFDICGYLYLEIFAYPDLQKKWYKPGLDAARKVLEKENFDAMISTSPPQTSHLIANQLKKEYGIPWIADIRDLWSQVTSYNHLFFRKYLDKRLEIRTLINADIITTTTEYYKKKLEILHNNKIYPILTGYDPDMTFLSEPEVLNFSIIHPGHLYHGIRDPEPLFMALQELNQENKIDINDFSIEFYGPDESWLIPIIEKYELQNIIKVYKPILKDDILKKEAKSQLLLLLTWDNPKAIGTIPAKLFEYLAVKRPILSIGFSRSVVKEFIESTNTGVHIESDHLEIKDQIERFYNEYKSTGKIEYKGIETEINKYTQEKMAEKFSEILSEITN